jgi:hypothetical protein
MIRYKYKERNNKMLKKFGITTGSWECGDKSKGESNLMIYCDDVTGQRIADCTNKYTWHSIKEKEANARLIASAPDMLKALIHSTIELEIFADHYDMDSTRFFIKNNIVVIEKSTDISWEQIKIIIEEEK